MLVTLQNDRGVWLEGEQLDAHVVDYFKTIFSENTTMGPMELFSNLGKRVTNDINAKSTCEFKGEDFYEALNEFDKSSWTQQLASYFLSEALAYSWSISHQGSSTHP